MSKRENWFFLVFQNTIYICDRYLNLFSKYCGNILALAVKGCHDQHPPFFFYKKVNRQQHPSIFSNWQQHHLTLPGLRALVLAVDGEDLVLSNLSLSIVLTQYLQVKSIDSILLKLQITWDNKILPPQKPFLSYCQSAKGWARYYLWTCKHFFLW